MYREIPNLIQRHHYHLPQQYHLHLQQLRLRHHRRHYLESPLHHCHQQNLDLPCQILRL
jgi:hypothetical protein